MRSLSELVHATNFTKVSHATRSQQGKSNRVMMPSTIKPIWSDTCETVIRETGNILVPNAAKCFLPTTCTMNIFHCTTKVYRNILATTVEKSSYRSGNWKNIPSFIKSALCSNVKCVRRFLCAARRCNIIELHAKQPINVANV